MWSLHAVWVYFIDLNKRTVKLKGEIEPSGADSSSFIHQGIRHRGREWLVCLLGHRALKKNNLSCIIMSICDLGQALVMHECLYRRTEATFSQETQSPLLWSRALLLWADVYVYSREPRATTQASQQLCIYGPYTACAESGKSMPVGLIMHDKGRNLWLHY